ncbi:MAG: ABC transporter permease [Bacteroidetes bacterium]|nr:ABC transporter permease [Bacteroidota bacterium]MCH8525143.1 FtsX-like permease family protein [Balneolales bacterium]
MKTLFILSWRNIWRKPARSGVLLAAITVGLWAGVVTVGIINGMMQQRVSYLIESEITHVQVHNPEFLSEGFARLYLSDHDSISETLAADPRVAAFASRTITDGMIQSPVKTSGVRIRGVQPDRERETTTFHENLTDGEYLDSAMRNAVLIGEKLAADHHIQLGDRVVLTFENTRNELVSGLFNVAGLFRSASVNYDEAHVFVRADDLIRLMGVGPIYHEIAVLLHEEGDAAAVAASLSGSFPEAKVRTWREISPELTMIVELGGVTMVLITAIIMIALAFGILNTMLMALFERMREIGMLLSIGMNRIRVFGMLMLESALLTLTGVATGVALALLTLRYYSERGMNLEVFADGAAQLGWDYHIYPVVTASDFGVIMAVVVVITMLASAYPAFKGVRVNPMEVT